MLREWNAELITAGGKEKDGAIECYENPRAEVLAASQDTVYCPLTHIAIIKASGADALSFLQGQLTNDLVGLQNASQLSAYCTAQGRAIALFRIIRHDDAIFLLLPKSLLTAVLKRLTMFVLRAKVTLSVADDWSLLGLSGPQAQDVLAAADLPAPSPPLAAKAQDTYVVAIPGATHRYLLLGPSQHIQNLAPSGIMRVGANAWAWLDIQAGLPSLNTQTSEAFVPQMINLDILGGINFRKGCYPGQEIVARTHYLGRLKQRMYKATLPAEGPLPAAGDNLSAPNLPGQPAGTVVDAKRGPSGQVDLLAVIQISSHDEGGVTWQDIPLCFSDLPYPLAASC